MFAHSAYVSGQGRRIAIGIDEDKSTPGFALHFFQAVFFCLYVREVPVTRIKTELAFYVPSPGVVWAFKFVWRLNRFRLPIGGHGADRHSNRL